MGKITGFLEFDRKNNRDIPPEVRITNFEEFHTPLAEEERRKQAGRCMNCGVPLCQSAMVLSGMVTGCPLHNLIPEWNDQIYEGHYAHAFARLIKTSNFPEFTGRVCPALCEKACMCGQYAETSEGGGGLSSAGGSVTVHDNELFLIEKAFEKGYIQPRIPAVRSGKRIAVVGSGPSGLAAADTLNHRGHQVTVYEREDRIGGLLMYGIPNMKLDKSVIERRRKLMEAEGVSFVTGFDVDDKEKASRLLDTYDAVILCCGSKQPRSLNAKVVNLQGEEEALPLSEVKGVYFAVDFLKATTKTLLAGGGKSVEDLKQSAAKSADERKNHGGFIDAANKHVVIVGGGDTGNDCIGTVIRHGCKSVTALEMMSAPPARRSPGNPWPEWPKTLKTDYGHEEAIYLYGKDPRIFETTVKECITNKRGELKKIKTVKVTFEGRTLKEVPGTEQILSCEILLIAAGFTGCQPYTAEAFSLERGPRGTIVTEAGHFKAAGIETGTDGMTNRNTDKIFTAGDMHRGQSLVVWAIAEGRACAREVDEYLMGYTTLA